MVNPGLPSHRGFTLIELLVVLAIVALLLTLAAPRYFQSLDASKEAILAENLRTVRETLDKFYGDHGRYPDNLDELVERHYLRSLPYDPITESSATWTVLPPRPGLAGQVYDLKSSAEGVARDGRPIKEF
jgi:general secretion pathway protein G